MPPSLKYSREITGYGWLSPEGKFYDVEQDTGFTSHNELASLLGYKEIELEKLGWIKSTVKYCRIAYTGKTKQETPKKKLVESITLITPTKYPTQAQIDVIFDFCQKEGIPMPEWAKVENPKKLPKPKRHITGNDGWISPDGKFYEGTHTDLAELIVKEIYGTSFDETRITDEVYLDVHRWLRVRDEYVEPMENDYKGSISQKQLDVIFDYYTKNGWKLPEWARTDNPKRKKNPRLSPGDQFELLEGFDIYIHDKKQHEAKIHRRDIVILAEPGDILRFDGLAGKSHLGRSIFKFTLQKQDGTEHKFDMLEPQVQKMMEGSVKLD